MLAIKKYLLTHYTKGILTSLHRNYKYLLVLNFKIYFTLILNDTFHLSLTVLLLFRSFILFRFKSGILNSSNLYFNHFTSNHIWFLLLYRTITFFGFLFQVNSIINTPTYLIHFQSPLLMKSFLISFPIVT